MARLQAICDHNIHIISIWGCEWFRLKKEDPQIKAFVDELTLVPPMNPRDAFFGGRTNAVHLYYEILEGERIFYIDYMSLSLWTNKYAMYPVGHPEFIYNPDTTDLSGYFDLATCTVLPPTRLFHPVLPYQCSCKLTFLLYHTCVEQDIDKALHDKSLTDAECALTWTWRIFHQRNKASSNRVQLEPENIKKNPGLLACTKMMLNSMWGKFGQRDNLMQHKVFYDPQPFHMFMDLDQHDVRYVSCLDEHLVEVYYKVQGECEDLNVNTNTFVAALTTCWARLHLYEALERLAKRVLYFDTDSVLYVSRPGEPQEMTGTHLCEFTNELDEGTILYIVR
ncbi:uncharacterized protein [Montipora foliosa]|uniref:uncharacterized protein n=1 Tax=Montipora foliosa TaxID=591990 RepID=UPI0035F1B26C